MMESKTGLERLKELSKAPHHLSDIPIDFGGVSGSKIPRFELIPMEALIALANRFELGEIKHKEKTWNGLVNPEALDNKEWITARASHVIHHALKYIAKLHNLIPDDEDDDAAAIMWGGTVLFEAKRKKDK
jgi:hypothetical protein